MLSARLILRTAPRAAGPTPLESIGLKLIDSKPLTAPLNLLESPLFKNRGGGGSNQFAIPLHTPSAPNTTGIVFANIFKSIPKLQFSMYSKSSFIFVSNDGSRRAVTCHNPVIPG